MSKTKQELFDIQAHEYGCGYWNSCWEHACPCNISVKCDGIYNEEIDKSLRVEAQRVADELNCEEDLYDDIENDCLNDYDDFYPDEPYEYIASIKNITKNKWLESEINGEVKHTSKEQNRLIFYDGLDAESTLAFLNEAHSDCYTLILESDCA